MTKPALAACLLAAAAAAGCGTYRVNRSALAPHPSPQLHPGAPMDSIAELGVGASSLGHVVDPEVGNPDASVEVPGTQLHGDLRARITDRLALGVLYQHGLDATAHKPKGDLQPDVDEGDVTGYGLSVEVAIPTSDPRLTVGLSLDAMMWSVPWIEWRTCVDDCLPGDGFTYSSSGTDSVTTVGIGLTPTWKMGQVTWFGGLTARQHPTIQAKDTEVGQELSTGDVESGPFAWTISAGAQIDFGAVKGSFVLYQTVTQDPVEYGPSAAALLVVPLGKRAKPAPAPAAAPAAAPVPAAAPF